MVAASDARPSGTVDTTAAQVEILARIVVDDDAEMREALNAAQVTAEAFDPSLRPIVAAIQAMRVRGVAINLVTLHDEMGSTPDGRQAFTDFSESLTRRLPSAETTAALVERVAEAGLLRYARMSTHRLTAYLASPHATPDGAATRARDLAAQITAHKRTLDDATCEQDALDAAEAIEALAPRGEAFPLEALPRAIREYATEAALAVGAPVEYIALPALAAASIAIGASREIEIKQGWREAGILWLAIIGAPGTAKSPAQATALRPMNDHQRELLRKYRDAKREYEGQDDDERDDYRRGDDERGAKRKEGPPPQLEQVTTTDATMEALADVLQHNPRGVLMMRDELSGLVRSLDQYKNGRGSDKSHYLSLWSGGDSAQFIVNRRGRAEPLVVERPHLSIIGAIQPDILGELADERGREDGFIHRFMFAWPANVRHRWSDAIIRDDVKTAYANLFRKLFALTGTFDPDGECVRPQVMGLTTDAYALWTAFYNDVYEQIDSIGLAAAMRGPLAKMPGQAARLALILHVCRLASGETTSWQVDAYSMASATALAQFFISHAQRVYAHLSTRPEDARAATILEWMRSHHLTTCTSRNLMRAGVAGVHTAAEAQAILENLATGRGLGKLEPRRGPGKPSFIFTLYPPDNRQFAENGPEGRQHHG